MTPIDLSVTLGAIKMNNPVMAASGTFGFGREYGQVIDLSALGAIVTKGITLKARPGNPPPRLQETPSGLLNSVGLQNPGVDAFLRHEAPNLATHGVPIIVNVSGDSVEEFCEIARRLDDDPVVDGIEVNVSCPNIHAGGRPFASDPESVYRVTAAVRRVTSKTILVKLSPNAADIGDTARAAETGGADAVSCVNTHLGIAIDAARMKPVFARVFAGLSGPAIKPLALRAVWEAVSAVNIPVVGIGGISGHGDAVEFLLAGARAVAVGTWNFVSPTACLEIVEGLRSYMEQRGVFRLADLVGRARMRRELILENLEERPPGSGSEVDFGSTAPI